MLVASVGNIARQAMKSPFLFGAVSSIRPNNLILVASVSTSGRDAKTKYPYYYNKHKQVKSKKIDMRKEAVAKSRAAKEEANKFRVDTSKPLSELLAYSAKK